MRVSLYEVLQKMLPCLLVLVMVLSAMPAMVFATVEPVTVLTEEGLIAAVEAIPEGKSGEINIENVNMSLSKDHYIENKDVTLNLVNTQLSAGLVIG